MPNTKSDRAAIDGVVEVMAREIVKDRTAMRRLYDGEATTALSPLDRAKAGFSKLLKDGKVGIISPDQTLPKIYNRAVYTEGNKLTEKAMIREGWRKLLVAPDSIEEQGGD